MNKSDVHASVTVEAAFLLPFFLFLMMNLLTVFDALRVQTALYASLHQTGREITTAAFDIRFAQDMTGAEALAQSGAAQAAGHILSAAYAGGRVRQYLAVLSPNLKCVKGGADGVTLMRSDILADADTVNLVASCIIRPFIRIAAFDPFHVEAHYYAHAWTGYGPPAGQDTAAADDDETVYITSKGAVYHRSASCTYLRPSVRAASSESLQYLRNESGGIYYPCEACGGGTGEVFVTPYGDRYHADRNCNKISHEVLAVPLREVSGRRACSKCGGTH